MPPLSDAACHEVSTVLWRERELLEGLAFALEVQYLMLVSGRHRWLTRACQEVESALGRLRSAELVRAVRVDILADQVGLPPSPSLRVVAAALPEPWREIFSDHREAFLALIGEVMRLAEDNRALLGSRRDVTEVGPTWLRPGPHTPTGTGHSLLHEEQAR